MPSIVLSNTHKTGQAENKETFNAMLKQQPLPFYIEYKNRGHPYKQPIRASIVYKRMTPIGDVDMWNLFTSAWFNEEKGVKNKFNVDFKLFDSYSDALFDKNALSSYPKNTANNIIRNYGWGNWTLTLYPNPFKKSKKDSANEILRNAMSSLDAKVYEGFEMDIDPFNANISFDDFKKHFENIKNSLEISSEGNHLAHMGTFTNAHLEVLTQAIDQLQLVYDNMQYIKDGCMPIFKEVMVKRLRLFYNGSGTTKSATSELSGRNWSGELSIMIQKFNQSANTLWQLKNYKPPLEFQLAPDEPSFDLDQMTHGGSRWYHNFNDPNMSSVWKSMWFIWYLLVWCKYFTDNQMNIDKFVHGFYDHLEIYNNPNFGFFKNNVSMEAISTNKNYNPANISNISYLSGTPWTTMINFIKISTQKVQFDRTTNHSIFGIDFTVFSHYLFHNCYNSSVFSPVDHSTINHIRQHHTGVTRKEGFLDYFARWYKSQEIYRAKYIDEFYPAVNELKASCIPTLSDKEPYWRILHSFNRRVNYASHSNTSDAILSTVRGEPIATALKKRANEINENLSKSRQARILSLFYKDIVEHQNRMDDNIKNRRHMKDFYNKVGFIGLKMNDYMGAAFLSKYSDLIHKARVDSGEIMSDDAYIAINETFTNREGFYTQTSRGDSSIFPTQETYLGDLDMRVLNDGYQYKLSDDNFEGLTTYFSDVGHKATYVNQSSNFIQCDATSTTDHTPEALLEFNCGKILISQDSYPYNSNQLTTTCASEFASNPSKIYTLTLVYSGSGSSPGQVKLVSSDGTNSSEYSLAGGIPNHDEIMEFDDATMTDDHKDSLSTDENAQTIQLLKANTDTETYLKGKDASDNTTMVLLFINTSGKLTMQFNLKPYREIGSSPTKYHGYYDGSGGNVINVYNASEDKYKVGQNMKKNGYVGYDGVFYPDNGADSVGKLGDKYEQITGLCYSETATSENINDQKTSCKSNENCYGIFNAGVLSNELITEENKKYLYKCGGSSDVNTGTYHHRKYATNSDNLACLRDASDTLLISYADHSDLSGNASSTPFVDASHCGYNQLLEGLKEELYRTKKDMDTAFNDLFDEFNTMSTEELSWLEKTESGLDEFKTIVDEHIKLRDEMEKKYHKQKVSQAQNRDNKNALETIEYKMAIAGIASICGVITLFQFMKN
jgi:hypothetical protein